MKIDYGNLDIVTCENLPTLPDQEKVYKLTPRSYDSEYYAERTDRNIGWITHKEQETLKGMTVGIAGCGGMGGLVASILLRTGVGELHIADCETFDVSNINRQFAAKRDTVGVSKVLATAQMLRDIADDTTITLYQQGITEETVDHFLDQCDVVCDEIEFWAVGARILLHQRAREKNITLLNCNTVGHRTYIFRFTSDCMPVEEPLGLSYEEGVSLQERIQGKIATSREIRRVMEAIIRTFIPIVPEYGTIDTHSTKKAFYDRLFGEGKGPILATNPPMASGFMANRVLLHLLRNSSVSRNIVLVPKMPGYLSFDAAFMETSIVSQQWW